MLEEKPYNKVEPKKPNTICHGNNFINVTQTLRQVTQQIKST